MFKKSILQDIPTNISMKEIMLYEVKQNRRKILISLFIYAFVVTFLFMPLIFAGSSAMDGIAIPHEVSINKLAGPYAPLVACLPISPFVVLSGIGVLENSSDSLPSTMLSNPLMLSLLVFMAILNMAVKIPKVTNLLGMATINNLEKKQDWL